MFQLLDLIISYICISPCMHISRSQTLTHLPLTSPSPDAITSTTRGGSQSPLPNPVSSSSPQDTPPSNSPRLRVRHRSHTDTEIRSTSSNLDRRKAKTGLKSSHSQFTRKNVIRMRSRQQKGGSPNPRRHSSVSSEGNFSPLEGEELSGDKVRAFER